MATLIDRRYSPRVPGVPDVTGLRLSEAFAALRGAAFQPVLIGLPTAKSDGNLGYWVAAQEPAAGVAAEAGTRVALAADTRALSWGGGIEGPPVAAPGTLTPNVLGVELEAAMTRVTSKGLIAVVFQPERGVEQPTISRQEPPPGQPVEMFREVALWLD
jgi:beta-lactam-binding protein with PASTA domain